MIRFNTTTFNYNPNGEMISKTNLIKLDFKKRRPVYETTSMQYDVFGNLVKHGKVSYKIDPLNKRLARLVDGVTTNIYAYNPEGQMIAELDQNGRLSKHFVYGSKSHVPDYFIDSNNEKFKIITDHLGSVRYVVNSSTGEVKLKMNHDEFGKVLVDTNPNYLPFGFAGGIYDSATGLVRFGVRDYDPEIGRWLSKDPIRFNGGDTNLYGYVMQDPINFIDPTGLARGDWWDTRTYILPIVEAGQGTMDFMTNYGNMRTANTIGADKYFHCMASCQASQRGPGGLGAAIGIGEGRELFDEYLKGDSASACNADRSANSQGRAGASGGSCSQSCNSLRPNGLGAQW